MVRHFFRVDAEFLDGEGDYALSIRRQQQRAARQHGDGSLEGHQEPGILSEGKAPGPVPQFQRTGAEGAPLGRKAQAETVLSLTQDQLPLPST